MAQTFESMKKYKGTDKTMIKTALNQAVDIVRENLADFTGHFQSSNSINQFYEPTENVKEISEILEDITGVESETESVSSSSTKAGTE